ncbi:hypothetical protein KR222_008282 [Zaprionus bogoriensis]|nr:hypothetical protein KR222_008282 [Zaprionus bogoriensis]
MNLLITSAPARTLLQFVLVTLALMPALIYGHGHHGSGKKHAIALAELASGAHLVMETRDGDVHVRPAREASASQDLPATLPAATPATGTLGGGAGGGAGGNKRVKNNNKKANKSQQQQQQNHMQSMSGGAGAGTAAGGRKSGHKKFSSVVAGEEPLQRGGKQQRQANKHQQEHQHRAGKRSGGKKPSEKVAACNYTKSSWTECDAKTKMRTRTLSLKEAQANCPTTRTVQRKCRNACRYEKGVWTECVAGKMTREDKLKPTVDGSPQPDCNAVRMQEKDCKLGGGQRSNKERKHKKKGK